MSDNSFADQSLSQSSVDSQSPSSSSEKSIPYQPPAKEADIIEQESPNFICLWVTCNQPFDCLEELSIHIDENHVSKLSSRKNVSCKWTECKRMDPFADITLLSQHIRSHTGEKPFKCSLKNCDARFAAKSNLIAHCKRRHGRIIDPIFVDPREQLKAGIRTTREILMLEANAIGSSQQVVADDPPSQRRFPKRSASARIQPTNESLEYNQLTMFASDGADDLLASSELESFFQNLQFDGRDTQMTNIVHAKLEEISSKLAQLDARLEQVRALNNEACYLLERYSSFDSAFPQIVVKNLTKFKHEFQALTLRIESKINSYTSIQETVKSKIFSCTLETLKIRYS